MSGAVAPKEMLERAGLRATRQRLAIIDALVDRSETVTAQELFHTLRGRKGSPGLATVYRTLTALAEADVVDTFPQDGEQAFRICGSSHHHHLVCTSCGKVDEVGAEEVETWIKRIARQRRFKVQGHTADIYGLCSKCV